MMLIKSFQISVTRHSIPPSGDSSSGLHSCTACFSLKQHISWPQCFPFGPDLLKGSILWIMHSAFGTESRKTLPAPAASDQEFMHGVGWRIRCSLKTKIQIYSTFNHPGVVPHPSDLFLLLWNTIKEHYGCSFPWNESEELLNAKKHSFGWTNDFISTELPRDTKTTLFSELDQQLNPG